METIALDYRNPRTIVVTLLFVGLVVGVGAVIGVTASPDAWYASLEKPPLNPPNWLFAPVWFTHYVMIGTAGARTYLRQGFGALMFLWIVQMLLNWAWSPTWFNLHMPWAAFAIIIALLALIVAFIMAAWRRDRVSALLFVPYAAWVTFASTLNLSTAILN
jgi:tryptophan-rich sensory protein